MWPWDRLGLCASVAVELGPDTRESEQRPILIERELDHVLLGLWVRLRRLFGKAVGRDQAAAVLRLEPHAPVWR